VYEAIVPHPPVDSFEVEASKCTVKGAGPVTGIPVNPAIGIPAEQAVLPIRV
jgi:hypothetical protein